MRINKSPFGLSTTIDVTFVYFKMYTFLDYLSDILLDLPFPHIMDLKDKNWQQTV